MQGLYARSVRLGDYEHRHPVRYGAGAAAAIFAVLWPMYWSIGRPLHESPTPCAALGGGVLGQFLHRSRAVLAIGPRTRPLREVGRKAPRATGSGSGAITTSDGSRWSLEARRNACARLTARDGSCGLGRLDAGSGPRELLVPRFRHQRGDELSRRSQCGTSHRRSCDRARVSRFLASVLASRARLEIAFVTVLGSRLQARASSGAM